MKKTLSVFAIAASLVFSTSAGAQPVLAGGNHASPTIVSPNYLVTGNSWQKVTTFKDLTSFSTTGIQSPKLEVSQQAADGYTGDPYNRYELIDSKGNVASYVYVPGTYIYAYTTYFPQVPSGTYTLRVVYYRDTYSRGSAFVYYNL